MDEHWSRMGTSAVGGLTDVGFSDDDGYLLVVGHQGRGVIDCRTGARVAQDPTHDWSFFDDQTATAQGIGPLDGRKVSLAGLMSGRALPTAAMSGWSVELAAGGPRLLYAARGEVQQIEETEEIRAFGFGSRGRTFVIATSSALTLFRLVE